MDISRTMIAEMTAAIAANALIAANRIFYSESSLGKMPTTSVAA
jgi:hypothetical protein